MHCMQSHGCDFMDSQLEAFERSPGQSWLWVSDRWLFSPSLNISGDGELTAFGGGLFICVTAVWRRLV